jgi:hypothetical protein
MKHGLNTDWKIYEESRNAGEEVVFAFLLPSCAPYQALLPHPCFICVSSVAQKK